MKIIVNTQSSIRIETEGKVIYVDPFEIKIDSHDADAIFFTHAHYDHFSEKDFSRLVKDDTVFAAPESMEKETKGLNAVLFRPEECKEVCGIRVEAIRAYNPHKLFHPKRNNWLGYVLTVEGERIYICGDTDCTNEAKAVSCDTIILPAGGKYTMNYEEAAELVNAIKPKRAIPTHYGTIIGEKDEGEKFAALVNPDTAVEFRLNF